MLTPENQLFLIRYKIVLEILSCSVSIKGRAISVQTVQYSLSQSEVFGDHAHMDNIATQFLTRESR
jgi:hypothetical protein